MDVPVSLLTRLMDLATRHARLVRLLCAPLVNAPLLRDRLRVLPRAFLGATAFEAHDVDLERGRIGIGGVDEIMWSSKFIELFHAILGEKLGEEEKNRALYAVGKGGGRWEIEEALRHGRWAPRVLADLVDRRDVLEAVRTDAGMARFFERAMGMVLRLIINEGGWGVATMDLRSKPIRVTLQNSQEARWLGPSDKPVCAICAGVVAGYASRLLRREVDAVEVRCAAMGARECVFEIDC